MASELFHRLYHQAFRLDCAVIQTLNRLKQGLKTSGKTLERVELALRLNDAGADFFDDCEAIGKRVARNFSRRSVAYRNANREYYCPNCRSPYCDNAVEVFKLPPGITVSVISPAGPVQSDDDDFEPDD
jgi:hypothetical protein